MKLAPKLKAAHAGQEDGTSKENMMENKQSGHGLGTHRTSKENMMENKQSGRGLGTHS